IGRRAGGGIGRVVGRIGAADADVADGDGLVGADGFVGETGAGVVGREAVAGHPVVGKSHVCVGVTIIDLVDSGGRYAQRFGRDVGGGAGRGIGRVVDRI